MPRAEEIPSELRARRAVHGYDRRASPGAGEAHAIDGDVVPARVDHLRHGACASEFHEPPGHGQIHVTVDSVDSRREFQMAGMASQLCRGGVQGKVKSSGIAEELLAENIYLRVSGF